MVDYNLGQKCWDILPNCHFFRVPNLFFSAPSPQLNVVNVGMLWKQSWVNCKPHETILNRGRGIKYFLPASKSRQAQKCVIFICLNWFCPRLQCSFRNATEQHYIAISHIQSVNDFFQHQTNPPSSQSNLWSATTKYILTVKVLSHETLL